MQEEGGGRMRRADVGFEIRPKGQRRTADMERPFIFVERLLIFVERLLVIAEIALA